MRFVMPVMLTHRAGGRYPLGPEQGLEFVQQAGREFAAQVFWQLAFDLFIEPGTVVKALSNPGAAHAIIVARNGQIWANGSEYAKP